MTSMHLKSAATFPNISSLQALQRRFRLWSKWLCGLRRRLPAIGSGRSISIHAITSACAAAGNMSIAVLNRSGSEFIFGLGFAGGRAPTRELVSGQELDRLGFDVSNGLNDFFSGLAWELLHRSLD